MSTTTSPAATPIAATSAPVTATPVIRSIPAPSRNPLKQRGFGRLVGTEFRVWLRDISNPFWALLFPTAMLLLNAFGSEGFTTETFDVPYYHQFYGMTPFQVVMPIMLVMAMALPFMTMMPVTFGTFRDKGILKRFSGSPMQPGSLVATHYLINMVGVIGGAAIAIIASAIAWGIAVPSNVLITVVAFLLGTLAVASLGTLIAARVPKASVANGVGMTAFFTLLFLGGGLAIGLDFIERIARFTPLGAAIEAMQTGWFGGGIPWMAFAVLLGWTAVTLPLGLKLFKWR
ncbi:MAG: ABC transporter permease [Cellulomonadaceae bacterium]|jgi:ABC-2 type transport system permease protein|nr:ABC transporter permease [Cellulomonadaceae bacterium]